MNTDAKVVKHPHISKLIRKIPINKHWKGHIVAIIGEFVGTFFFLFLAFTGAQTANVSSNPNTGDTVITEAPQKTPQQLLYTALSFGFSLAVNAWVFFRISGGLFNPAVSYSSSERCPPCRTDIVHRSHSEWHSSAPSPSRVPSSFSSHRCSEPSLPHS